MEQQRHLREKEEESVVMLPRNLSYREGRFGPPAPLSLSQTGKAEALTGCQARATQILNSPPITSAARQGPGRDSPEGELVTGEAWKRRALIAGRADLHS